MGREDFYTEDNFKDEYPPSWKPRVGDFLGGKIVHYDFATTEYRGEVREHPIAVIKVEHIKGGVDEDVQPGDEVGFWLMHTVAISKFEKLSPKPGERVGIKKVESPEGKDYHNYVVRVDRDEADEEVPDFKRFRTGASDHGHAPADFEKEEDDGPFAHTPQESKGDVPPPHDDSDLPF